MSRFIIDSSIVIKWFVPEIHSDDALRYLDPTHERHAPELMLAEVANVLWKKAGRGEITRDVGLLIAKEVENAPITIYPMTSLVQPALAFAYTTGRTAYDSMYLALAESLSIPVVTADRRFFNAIQGTGYAKHVLWVEDGP